MQLPVLFAIDGLHIDLMCKKKHIIQEIQYFITFPTTEKRIKNATRGSCIENYICRGFRNRDDTLSRNLIIFYKEI